MLISVYVFAIAMGVAIIVSIFCPSFGILDFSISVVSPFSIYSLFYVACIQIVEFNLTVSDRQEISSLEEVQIFYSVEYVESPVQFSEREEIHRNEEYYEHQVHWFSLGNSLMMVVFLCGLAAIVVFRALRKDMNSTEDLHLSPAEVAPTCISSQDSWLTAFFFFVCFLVLLLFCFLSLLPLLEVFGCHESIIFSWVINSSSVPFFFKEGHETYRLFAFIFCYRCTFFTLFPFSGGLNRRIELEKSS